MNTTQILHLTRHPEFLNRDTLYELRNLLSHYPYFSIARILYLHNLYLLREQSFQEELKMAALQVSDRHRLFQVIEGHKYQYVPKRTEQSTPAPSALQGENQTGESRTLDLINQFLSQQPEKEILVPFDLTSDYTTYLLEENTESSPIEKPAKKERPHTPARPTPLTQSIKEEEPEEEPIAETEAMDESYFTLTLAKIYTKQGQYEKALEIIKSISLKNPKKSAYFADQIRYLEKLIINSKKK